MTRKLAALWASCALACAPGAASAQSVATGTMPSSAANSAGTAMTPSPVDPIGYDTATGFKCLVGSSATCTTAPGSGGGGGGGGGAVQYSASGTGGSTTYVSPSSPLPSQPNGPAITLATGGTSAGTVTPPAGYYYLNLPSTFGGATATLTATSSNGTVVTTTYTSQPSTPPGFAVAAGTTLALSYSGGTPTGNTTLAGGPAPASTSSFGGAVYSANSTPQAGATNGIVTGGTAVTLITASTALHGCYVTNGASATDEGISTVENFYVNPVSPAGTTGNGTTSTIQPGQSWNCPPGMTTALSGNAATAAHKVTVVSW